jgi:hypothetical protein
MNFLTGSYSLPGIHQDDLAAAVEARKKLRLADAKRRRKKPLTTEEVLQDLFLASVGAGPIEGWPDWLRWDVINYAADCGGGGQFLIKLGKAVIKGKSVLFDRTDIFILRNWREGHQLRDKTRAEAVRILRTAKLPVSVHDAKAQEDYGSWVKRLGLSRPRKH